MKTPIVTDAQRREIYNDWTAPDPNSGIAQTNGGSVYLDLGNHSHSENLFLTMTVDLESNDESRAFNDIFNDGHIKLRSTDVRNKPGAPDPGGMPDSEHNFGWLPSDDWGLKWGTNTIVIPLGKAMDTVITSNNNTRSNYTIEVNGVDMQVNETHLGLIDWTDVNRIIMRLGFSNNMSAGQTVEMTLSDVRIIDATIKELTAGLRDDLAALMADKIEKGDYTTATYEVYEAAYEKADAIIKIADWPTPLMHAIQQLQAAIDGLEIGEDPIPDPIETTFGADLAEGTAKITNATDAEGPMIGNAIIAVYDNRGRLVATDTQAFNIPAGGEENIAFELELANYPVDKYRYKVFFWDNAYVPLTSAIAS
jgi:hypothetical protein